MFYSRKNNHSKSSMMAWVGFILLVIVIQGVYWSYKGSGALHWSIGWNYYPWGFRSTLSDYNNWPILRENLFYIHHFLAFLGVDGAVVERASGFELHRSLYGLLMTGVWFLGPIYAGLFINGVCWFLSILSMIYVANQLFDSNIARISSFLFVAFGQGFLYSVGEISPHVMGYSSSFLILAASTYYKVWDVNSSFYDHLKVYMLIGILQLAYNSPWLNLAFLFPLSMRRELFHYPRSYVASCLRLSLLCLIAMVPFQLFTMITHKLIDTEGVVIYVLKSLWEQHTFMEAVNLVLIASVESFLAYGPILCLLMVTGFGLALYKRNGLMVYTGLITILLFLVVGLFTCHTSGKGYVSYGIAAYGTLLSVYACHQLWQGTFNYRLAVTIMLVMLPLYVYGIILDPQFVLRGFSGGYMTTIQQGQWQSYEVHTFT